jgi:predicted RND superfamily exporter protein
MKRKNKFLVFMFIFLCLFFLKGTFAIDWNDSTEDFYGLEDNFYSYNVSKNVFYI